MWWSLLEQVCRFQLLFLLISFNIVYTSPFVYFWLISHHKAFVGPNYYQPLPVCHHFGILSSYILEDTAEVVYDPQAEVSKIICSLVVFIQESVFVVVVVRSEQDKEPEPEVASEASAPGPSDDSAADGMCFFPQTLV